jgi:hypothetical protein
MQGSQLDERITLTSGDETLDIVIARQNRSYRLEALWRREGVDTRVTEPEWYPSLDGARVGEGRAGRGEGLGPCRGVTRPPTSRR